MWSGGCGRTPPMRAGECAKPWPWRCSVSATLTCRDCWTLSRAGPPTRTRWFSERPWPASANLANDAIMLTVRPPTKELWFLRTPKIEESFLAMAIMGIVIIQNVTMLGVWSDMLAWVDQTTGITSYPVIFTAVFAVGVSIPVALLALSAKVASLGNLENTFKNFARFGYALIPLDAAAHVAQPVPPARRGQLGVPHAISQFPWSPHAAVVLLAACDSDTAAGTDAVKLEGDPKAWPASRLGVVPTGGGPRLHRAPCTAVA
jgi:hypothetical protein